MTQHHKHATLPVDMAGLVGRALDSLACHTVLCCRSTLGSQGRSIPHGLEWAEEREDGVVRRGVVHHLLQMEGGQGRRGVEAGVVVVVVVEGEWDLEQQQVEAWLEGAWLEVAWLEVA